MLSEKQQHALQIIVLILGGVAGWIFLSPMLHNNVSNSILIGMLFALLTDIAIFPDLRKRLFEQPSEKRMRRIMEEHQLGFYRSLTHPTQIPFTLSLILLIVSIFLVFLLGTLKIKVDPNLSYVIVFGIAFLWGLSGFLIITRNEYIDKSGRRYHGFWAIFNGSVLLLFGWGSIIALILASIFHW